MIEVFNKAKGCLIKACALFVFLFSYSINMTAQDEVVLSVSYDASFKSIKEKPCKKDQMELLVGKQSSRFYSVLAVRQQQILDSVMHASDGDLSQILAASSRFRATSAYGQKYEVYKHLPTDDKLTFTTTEVSLSRYKYEEPMPTFDWQLQEGDTVIAEYPCFKATAEFRGKKWTALYTPEIAISDGPWKLCGLPGLILQASTDDGDFSFVCTAIRLGGNREIKISTKGFETIKPQKLQELIAIESDPAKMMEMLQQGMDMRNTDVRSNVRSNGKRQQITPVFIEDYSNEK